MDTFSSNVTHRKKAEETFVEHRLAYEVVTNFALESSNNIAIVE